MVWIKFDFHKINHYKRTMTAHKILYAEDDPRMIKIQTELFSYFTDAVVVGVSTVDEAIKILSERDHEFTCVITDNNTNSTHKGIELVEAFAATIPVIMNSADLLEADVKRNGALFISKGINGRGKFEEYLPQVLERGHDAINELNAAL